jgi:hypothetical protein
VEILLYEFHRVIDYFHFTVIIMLDFEVYIWDAWVLEGVKEPKSILQS